MSNFSDNFIIISRLLGYDSDWLNARPTYQSIFFTILMRMAFSETTQDRGGIEVSIKPFQLYVSLNQLAEWTSKWITKDDVEGALKYFSKYKFLLQEVLHKKTMITIIHSDICDQITQKTPTKTPPSFLHHSSIIPLQKKNVKNVKNEKEEQTHQSAKPLDEKVVDINFSLISKVEETKLSFGEEGTVKLTQKQHDQLLKKMPKAEIDDWIEQVSLYRAMIGPDEFEKKYKCHYSTILTWRRRREQEKPKQNKFERRTLDKDGKPVVNTKQVFF